MIRFYSPILLLQLFCLYHAYSNKTEQRWYWIIIFFPFFGSIIYLYQTFYNRKNIDDLSEGVKVAFVSNYKIDKLEKQLKYSDTINNKIELADEHSIAGNYDRALNLYKSCLEGLYADDPKLLSKILKNSYLKEDYESAVYYGEQISDDKLFSRSEEKIALALSYYQLNNTEKAEQVFQEMDIRFTNYKHRLEYANFLKLTGENDKGQEKLEELISEIDAMDNYEKRLKKPIYKEIKKAYQAI